MSLASFAVLVNGEPTSFFQSIRRLRQGFPLSPFLFLFIVEALSRLIHNAKRSGSLKGVKMTQLVRITHLLFVDDVIFLGEGTYEECKAYKDILELFCREQVCVLVILNLLS